MKNILDAPFVKEMCDTTANMYRLGWDERNGGNISYMLDKNEVAEYLDLNNVIRTIPTGFDAADLIGKIFIVTGTGKYFKNVKSGYHCICLKASKLIISILKIFKTKQNAYPNNIPNKNGIVFKNPLK